MASTDDEKDYSEDWVGWEQRTPGGDPEKMGKKLSQEMARTYGGRWGDKTYDGVCKGDKDDIDYFHLTIDGESASHQKNQLSNLRVFSDFVDKPILEHSAKEVNLLLKKLERKRGWKTDPPGSRSNYAISVAAMFRAHGEEDVASDIIIPEVEPEDIDPDDVINWNDDIMPMINEGCKNARDRALLASLWEASNRIGVHCALKIKHYDPHEDHAFITIPKDMDEGDKDADGGMKPIIISKGYIDKWLADHPCPDDSEAALFPKIAIRDTVDEEGDHISPQRVRDLMGEAAERADIDERKLKRAKPHEMRHSRATYMRESDSYGKDDIETLMDWSDSTVQHDRYEHTEAEDEAKRILRKQGIITEETEMDPIKQECHKCGLINAAGAGYCNRCGDKLDDTPADWFLVYEAIAPSDDDPIIEKYGNIKGATPPIHNVSKSVFERVYYAFCWARFEQYFDQSEAVKGTDLEWLTDIDTSNLGETDYEKIKSWLEDETLAQQYLSTSVDYEVDGTPLADISELRELAEEMGE